MNVPSLLELVRHYALPYNRAPIGTPPARIEVLTARGKRVLTTKRARSGDTPGRTDQRSSGSLAHE